MNKEDKNSLFETLMWEMVFLNNEKQALMEKVVLIDRRLAALEKAAKTVDEEITYEN